MLDSSLDVPYEKDKKVGEMMRRRRIEALFVLPIILRFVQFSYKRRLRMSQDLCTVISLSQLSKGTISSGLSFAALTANNNKK